VSDHEKKKQNILRKGSHQEDVRFSREFEINTNNISKYGRRDTNRSKNYKPISEFTIFENKFDKFNSLKINKNNLRIDPINFERENINNIPKSYFNNNSQKNNFKYSPRIPNKINHYITNKIGISDTNHSKNFI
jgi:hypothetical protein